MERVRLLLWISVLLTTPPGLSAIAHDGVTPDNFSLFEENGKVGLKDQEGQVLIPATYEAIGWSTGTFSIVDKVVGYRLNGLWGLIHTSNKVITPPQFLELKPGEGSFLVAKKKSALSQRPSYGIVTTSGKTIIPCLYDGLQLTNMRAVVMSKSGARYYFGLLDLSGKTIIPLEYQRIYGLGSLRFAVENFDNKTAIFSEDGQAVTGFLIDSISSFKSDYAVVYQNQRQGVIDRNGQVIVKPIYSEIRMQNGTIEGRNPHAWFFLDAENNVLREEAADDIRPLSATHYALTSGGKMRLTDNEFEPLSPQLFSRLDSFQNGMAIFRSGDRAGIIDGQGRIVIPAEYDQLIMDGKIFRACVDRRKENPWMILDHSGKPLTQKHYERIGKFDGELFPVRSRGFWGAVNAAGEEIIRCVHDSLGQRQGNRIVVKFKGQYGIIDLEENWLITPQDNRLRALNDETYFEYAGNTTILKSFSGNTIYFSDNLLSPDGDRIIEHLPSGACRTLNMHGVIVSESRQPEETEHVFPEREGFRAILKDGKYGFIDEEGRLRIANRYEAVKSFSEGMAAIRILGQWGFIDREEKLRVQPVYDEVENFVNGLAVVKKDGLSGLINKNGAIVLPLRYDDINLNSHQRWTVTQHGLHGLANADGQVVIHPKYNELTDTGNGYVMVQRGGKSGLLTLGGVSTIPMIYDDLKFDPYHHQYIGMKTSHWTTLRDRPVTPQ